MLNPNKIRKDFKILSGEKPPIYFDNACMSLKPDSVVAAINQYYFEYPACAVRSPHKLADKATRKIEETRQLVAKFINAKSEKEIIFTRNTTEGLNLLANSFGLKKDDVVLVSDKEHNSNLVPWLVLRDKIGIAVKIIRSNEDGSFNFDNFKKIISGAKLISIVYTSNLDGVTNPVKEIIEIAHQNKVLVMLDAAQTMLHQKVDVQKLDADFLAFSGHKMLGPTGTGIFYGKQKLLEKLEPFIVGGETISSSTYDSYEFLPVPEKFEAGLQDYAGIIGLEEAAKYLSRLDFKDIQEHELKLNAYLTDELKKIPQIRIIGPEYPALRGSILNFYIPEKDMHQISVMLDEIADIAVRSGRHCMHAWFEDKKIYNSARISLSFYNIMEEAELFVDSLNKIIKIL